MFAGPEALFQKQVESTSGLQSVSTVPAPSLQVRPQKEVARPPSLRTLPAREYDPGKWYIRYGEPVLLGTPTQIPEEDLRFVFLEEGEEPPKSQSELELETRLAAKLNQSAGTQSTLSAVAQAFSDLWEEFNLLLKTPGGENEVCSRRKPVARTQNGHSHQFFIQT